jgi:hypothetical protein
MHVETGGTIKGTFHGKLASRPRHGSRIRALYDLFKASEGSPIEFKIDGHQRPINTLRDTYGLDIRCIRRGTWVLAGEWFGYRYVDYIAQRITERSRP